MTTISAEYINITTSEGIVIQIPKNYITTTEYGSLREKNQQFFQLNHSIELPFSLSAISSTIIPNKQNNDLHLLDQIQCLLYFYPSSISNLKISTKFFHWSFNDQTHLNYSHDCIPAGKLFAMSSNDNFKTAITVSVNIPEFNTFVTLNDTNPMEFLDFVEEKFSVLNFPVDVCRFFFASVGVPPFASKDLKNNQRFYSWLDRICLCDSKNLTFSNSALLSNEWISFIEYPLMNKFGKFVNFYLRDLNFDQNQKINQNLVSHLLRTYPNTKKILWPYIESDENYRNFIQNSCPNFNYAASNGDFKKFLKKLFKFCCQQPDVDNLINNLCETIVDIWKMNTSVSYCPVHYFVQDFKNILQLQQKLINILSQRIFQTPNNKDKKIYVMHLQHLLS